jgi:hypothetical protein
MTSVDTPDTLSASNTATHVRAKRRIETL